jgi:hypothetical protein
MAKENTPNQGQVSGTPKVGTESTGSSARSEKRKEKGKESRPRIGGTAVQGAKSTQPKPVPTSNNPNQQQMESYNRTMRRRMEQIGAGPEGQNERLKEMREKRKKRIERKKRRIEEKRATIRKSLPSGGIKLGSRNFYFLIGTAAVIIVIIVLFLVFRNPF